MPTRGADHDHLELLGDLDHAEHVERERGEEHADVARIAWKTMPSHCDLEHLRDRTEEHAFEQRVERPEERRRLRLEAAHHREHEAADQADPRPAGDVDLFGRRRVGLRPAERHRRAARAGTGRRSWRTCRSPSWHRCRPRLVAPRRGRRPAVHQRVGSRRPARTATRRGPARSASRSVSGFAIVVPLGRRTVGGVQAPSVDGPEGAVDAVSRRGRRAPAPRSAPRGSGRSTTRSGAAWRAGSTAGCRTRA